MSRARAGNSSAPEVEDGPRVSRCRWTHRWMDEAQALSDDDGEVVVAWFGRKDERRNFYCIRAILLRRRGRKRNVLVRVLQPSQVKTFKKIRDLPSLTRRTAWLRSNPSMKTNFSILIQKQSILRFFPNLLFWMDLIHPEKLAPFLVSPKLVLGENSICTSRDSRYSTLQLSKSQRGRLSCLYFLLPLPSPYSPAVWPEPRILYL